MSSPHDPKVAGVAPRAYGVLAMLSGATSPAGPTTASLRASRSTPSAVREAINDKKPLMVVAYEIRILYGPPF